MTARRCAWALVLLGLALMLCGCQTTETVYVDRVVEVRPQVAASLLRCKAEPAPLDPAARQRDVAPYALDLAAAGRDCRRKLGSVARIVGATP